MAKPLFKLAKIRELNKKIDPNFYVPSHNTL